MNSKKGQVEDWLPTMILIIGFIFIFLFFIFPDAKQQEKREIAKSGSIDLQAEEILISFLNQHYNYQETEISVGEAIQLYIDGKDRNLLDRISLKARDFFSETVLETDTTTWSLEIQDETTNVAINNRASKPAPVNVPSARKAIAETMIPNIGQSPIKIKLFLDTK